MEKTFYLELYRRAYCVTYTCIKASSKKHAGLLWTSIEISQRYLLMDHLVWTSIALLRRIVIYFEMSI